MKLSEALLVGMCSALIAAALLRAANFAGTTELKLASQPAFDRVIKTHTLRCAYSSMKPYFVTVDADRNMVNGLSHDIVEQMGRILGLKIEWVQEVAATAVAADLAAGDEDAMCFPLWPDGRNAATLDFTHALDYMPVYAVVRADDTRFDGNLSKLNVKDIIIPIIPDGEGKTIADEDFPLAQQYNITVEADPLHMILAVTTKKGDVAFSDPFTAGEFMRNNPGMLKYATGVAPVRVFPESFAVAKGETKLRDMMNVAIDQMQESGFIRATLDKYLGDHKGEYFYWSRGWEP